MTVVDNNSKIEDQEPAKEQMYVSTNGDKAADVAFESNAPPNIVSVSRSLNRTAMGNSISMAALSGTSTSQNRPGYSRNDYNTDRPEEKLPTGHADIIAACQGVYRSISAVRSVIDLMADFSSEGLVISHRIKAQQRFYRKWMDKVDLQGRAHDFMKLLLRDGNVVVKRKKAKLSFTTTRQLTKGFIGLDSPFSRTSQQLADDLVPETVEKVPVDKGKIGAKEIPWKYSFISPVLLIKLSGPVGQFMGTNEVALRLDGKLRSAINSPKNKVDKELVRNLPREVLEAAKKSGRGFVRLDPRTLWVDHYKKDDWEDWATPFLYSVLDDLMFKDRMRLADLAALDGVINVLRVWKLGNSKEKILPTSNAVNKLLGILANNVGGGALDIVWDDMIDLEVEYPPTDKILGAEKYISVDKDIGKGLGVPEILLGGSAKGAGGGGQTAFVQLKTLTERLQYVRGRCLRWIQNEIDIVRKAMGWSTLPIVHFGNMSLKDEVGEKKLILQMLDRGIISIESVQAIFGSDFTIELENLKREQRIREDNPPIIERSGPFNRPESVMESQHEKSLEIEDRRASNRGGENLRGDQPGSEEEGDEGGRPPGTKDSQPRKDKTDKVLSLIKGNTLMSRIDAVIDPLYLKRANRKQKVAESVGKRGLTLSQRQELEGVKWRILCALPADCKDDITSADVKGYLDSADKSVFELCDGTFRRLAGEFYLAHDRKPELLNRRILMVYAWAEII